MPKTSVIMWLLARNIPLGHSKEWTKERVLGPDGQSRASIGFFSEKDFEEAARRIVNGLSQYSVAEQVAREWGMLSPILRMKVTDLANTGWRSGNVSKGIAYLDQLLGGKIRRRETGPTEQELRTIGGQLVRVERGINPAVAGAERAFGGFVRPPHYAKLSPAAKKRINQQLATERRAQKRSR